MKGNDGRKMMIINMVRAGEERLPRCLTDEKEFKAWGQWKECERKRKIEAGIICDLLSYRGGGICTVAIPI